MRVYALSLSTISEENQTKFDSFYWQLRPLQNVSHFSYFRFGGLNYQTINEINPYLFQVNG